MGGKMSPGGWLINQICLVHQDLTVAVIAGVDRSVITFSQLPQMSRNSTNGSRWGWLPRFGDLDHLPQPSWERPQLPHPPQRGVHTAPVFLECRLSAPSSTKETLTAINYHAGRTRGIPLGFSSDLCLRTQTPPGLGWFSACLTNEPGCFVLGVMVDTVVVGTTQIWEPWSGFCTSGRTCWILKGKVHAEMRWGFSWSITSGLWSSAAGT